MIKPKHVLFEGSVGSGVGENLALMWDAFVREGLEKAIIDCNGVIVTMEKKPQPILQKK